MSIYTYGTTFPWSDNIIAPPGRFDTYLSANNFYQTYAITKNKPVAISETAAAFHVNSPVGPGVGELATKQSWWQQFMTNATYLDAHKKLKLICLFEFAKYEEKFANGVDDFRDFRITTNPTIASAFLKDFNTVKSRYIFAHSPGSSSSSGYALSASFFLLLLAIGLLF